MFQVFQGSQENCNCQKYIITILGYEMCHPYADALPQVGHGLECVELIFQRENYEKALSYLYGMCVSNHIFQNQ